MNEEIHRESSTIEVEGEIEGSGGTDRSIDKVGDEEGEGNESDGDEEMEDANDEEEDDEEDNSHAADDNNTSEREEEDADSDGEEAKTPAPQQQRYHVPKIFQDAITVLIPLDVTADLKIAIKRTRDKRITSIYKRFPSLRKEAKKLDDKDKDNLRDDDDPMGDEDDEENAKEKEEKQAQKKRKTLENVPQPNQFGSVLDYLEAKYVKGVMLEEDDEPGMLDDKSEGQGSVYSKDSFLDDADLQRDVAEQVMASTTLTKLELEHEDGDFFVNIGTLEVENDDYGENYDPLQDKENKTTKKRKKPSSAVSTSKSSEAKTPAPKTKKAKTEVSGKKKEPTSSKSKKSASSVASTKSKKTPQDKANKLAAKKAKSHADALFKKAAAMIKKLTAEDLPRLKTKQKVALKCPKNKQPGDDITFTNPHNPGQKLRVKVPKDCFPGGTFKVTVPVKHRPGDTENEKDRNKLPRDLQEALDVFGKAYDEWCTAQSKVESTFETFKEKQAKFDKLAKLFPKNLITPIDSNYLKQVVRRARQNKYKRSKTAAAKNEKVATTKEKPSEPDVADEESAKEDSDEDEEDEPTPPKKYRVVHIPTTGADYITQKFDPRDFMPPANNPSQSS